MASSNLQDEAIDIFSNVIQGFRNSLGQKEKDIFKEFNSSREMLNDLTTRCKDVRNGRKLSSLCRKIERFATAWEPFFEVTNIFVQTHPEFAGLAWGAIRLVFLLGTNYTTYLEKIVTMIQKIGEALPAYEEYYRIFMARRRKAESEASSALPTQTLSTQIRYHRLYKALAYVYADIVQFCQQACKIFSTKRGGVNYKPSLISDLFWKPFDARFSDLLDRLRSHQEVFRCEMQLEESKYMDLQNDKRAHQSERDGQVLLKIQQQGEDLRQSIDQLESRITVALADFERKIRETINERNSKELERREAEAMSSKVSDIKKWVNAPEYMREFEKAQKTRLPDTGNYVFSHSVYQSWKSGKSLQHEGQPAVITPNIPQILLVTGKPGHGKTILSSLLIDDLKDFLLSDGAVLFYHFVTERRDYYSPYYALRAVLVQLVQKFHSHKDVIDRISVLMMLNNGGQLTASDQDIYAALSLILESFEDITLVFDGLDECEAPTAFLQIIQELCASTPTKAVILGRPNVDLPVRFQHFSIHLPQSSNLEDIKTYLEPQIFLLQNRRLIPEDVPIATVVDTLSARAEGIFLWAWLMIQYLSCRALSPKERLAAIFEEFSIGGLDNMYEKILRVLDRGYAREKASIRMIFEIISICFRPVLATELQIALAITPGKVTETSSFIVEFEESLPIICGAVVEIQSDGSVRFIHSSFREFLVSSSDSIYRGSFTVNERAAHIRCATKCLSYLIYDLPSSPLSMTIGTSSAKDLKVAFPFIKYAQQWVKHAASGFGNENVSLNEVEAGLYDEFYGILAKFINRPLTVTVWIEASRTYGLIPSLQLLMTLRSNQWSSATSASLLNSGNLVATLLEELATELERLNQDWGHLLEEDPSAIWKPSITAFSRSSYWFETKDTTVSSLLPSGAVGSFRSGTSRSVLILSQLSSAEDELGIVLVLPSRYLAAAESIFGAPQRKSYQKDAILSNEDKQKLIKVCSSGWNFQYQRRRVRDEKVLVDIEVGLPELQVFQMLQQCLSSKTPHRFPFPVTFSHDLDRLVVLRCLLMIPKTKYSSGQIGHQYRFQLLENENTARPTANGSEGTVLYSVFSPDAKAFTVVFNSPQPGIIDFILQVWTETFDQLGTCYQCRGEVTTSQMFRKKKALRNQFAFHPYLPLLVYTELNTTAAWLFNDTEPTQRLTIMKQPVSSLEFCNNGLALNFRKIQHTGKYDEDLVNENEDTSEDEHTEQVWTSELKLYPGVSPELDKLFLSQHPSLHAESSQIQSSSPQVEPSHAMKAPWALQTAKSMSTFVNHETQTQQVIQGGSVTIGSKLVAQLPRLQRGYETHISLLPSTENDKWVRMVWNKGAQDTYSIHDYQSPHLPSIIYRRQGTIENTYDNFSGVKRRRLQ